MIADLVIANLLRVAREDLDGAIVLAQREPQRRLPVRAGS
jgi:hypothetical protein